MTDMDEAQAAIPGETSLTDEQLIALLVPPPRPRRYVIFGVVAVAALVAGLVAVSAAGVIVPRLDVWIDRWTVRDHSLTVVFRVRNQGSVDAKIRSLDARSVGLEGMRAQVPRPRTVGAHQEREVSVHFDTFDCTTVAGTAGTRDVRVRVTNSLGVTFTHTYPVRYLDGGWAQELTQDACSHGGRSRR
jgi:hypothetical protein